MPLATAKGRVVGDPGLTQNHSGPYGSRVFASVRSLLPSGVLSGPVDPADSSQSSGSDSNLVCCTTAMAQRGLIRSSGLIVPEAHRGTHIASRSVRSGYHEQNSVSKAGDPFARMIQHGMTRDRPVRVG